MSWFSVKEAPTGPNFFPVTSELHGYGPLSDKDTEWVCNTNRGFGSETHTWYTILEDGCSVMIQIIWSTLGIMLIPPTTQMTFKHYNPKTKESTWRSVNVSGFKTNGRSSKSDKFEIKHTGSASGEEKYEITANLDKSVQITTTFVKPASAPGFKWGAGENGGISTFGYHKEDGKRDGFVVHRFQPLQKSSGSLIVNGQVIDLKGEAMFVHAIQGMRPDALATRWNFAFFTSGGGKENSKLGDVRAVQMEFETTDSYGPKGAKSGRTKVNIGAIYASALSSAPLIVTGQTSPASEVYEKRPTTDISAVVHTNPIKDEVTGYSAPGNIEFTWESERRDGKGKLKASVAVAQGKDIGVNGLIEKVDVLGEIPYVIRKSLAAATGTKPFIFQYHNAATLNVETEGETIPVSGWLFDEATFVSA